MQTGPCAAWQACSASRHADGGRPGQCLKVLGAHAPSSGKLAVSLQRAALGLSGFTQQIELTQGRGHTVALA